MKELIYGLNREFESRIRLGIMSILMVNDKVEFKSLKELLELTDGNLASHLSALEKAEIHNVGQLLAKLAEGSKAVLDIEGFGRKSLIDMKKSLRKFGYEIPAAADEIDV